MRITIEDKDYEVEVEVKDGVISGKEVCETNTGRYVICRTYSAGVFAGFLEYRNGKEAKLTNARRLWHWTGAASLSELAEKGTSSPSTCKWPIAVKSVELTDVIEVLDVSAEAIKTFKKVSIWTAH